MSGVGKSATINSLLGEGSTITNAFDPETKKVKVITGTVKGIRMRFIDTPGPMPSASMTGKNQRMLSQVQQQPPPMARLP
jgi:predicted GTPase